MRNISCVYEKKVTQNFRNRRTLFVDRFRDSTILTLIHMENSLFYATGWLGEDASKKPTWTHGRRATHVTICVAVAVIDSLLKNTLIPTIDEVYGASRQSAID